MTASRRGAFASTLAANLAIVIFGIATGVLTARLLGPEGRGQLAALSLWPQLIAALGFLSLGDALVSLIGRFPSSAARYKGAAVISAGLLVVGTWAVGWFLLPALLDSTGRDLVAAARPFFLIYVFFNFAGLVLVAISQGSLHFTRFNLYRLIPPSTYLLAIVLIWALANATPVNLLWGLIPGVVMTTLVPLVGASRGDWAKPTVEHVRTLLLTSARMHGHALIAIMTSYADRAAVLFFFDHELVGQYVVAWTVASTALSALSLTLGMVVMPFAAYEKGRSGVAKAIGVALRYATCVASAVCLGLLPVLPIVIPSLFGRSFESSIAISMILTIAFGLAAIRAVAVACLKGAGYLMLAIKGEAVVLVVLVLCLPMCNAAPTLVASSCVFANLLGLLWLLRRLSKEFELRASDMNGVNRATVLELWGFVKETTKRKINSGEV